MWRLAAPARGPTPASGNASATGPLSAEDFHKICRLCSTRGGPMFPFRRGNLTSKHSTCLPDLETKIYHCTSINVCSSDHLPRQICATCYEMIEVFFTFKTFCLHVDTRLKNTASQTEQHDERQTSSSANSSREHCNPRMNPCARLDSWQPQTTLDQALGDTAAHPQNHDLPPQVNVSKASLTVKPQGPNILKGILTSNSQFAVTQNGQSNLIGDEGNSRNKYGQHLTLDKEQLLISMSKVMHPQFILSAYQLPTSQQLGQDIYMQPISGRVQSEGQDINVQPISGRVQNESSVSSPCPPVCFRDGRETDKCPRVDPVGVDIGCVPDVKGCKQVNVLNPSSISLQTFSSKPIKVPQYTRECDTLVRSRKRRSSSSELNVMQRSRTVEHLTSAPAVLPRIHSVSNGLAVDQHTSPNIQEESGLATIGPLQSHFGAQQKQTSSTVFSPHPNLQPSNTVFAKQCPRPETFAEHKSANNENRQHAQITSKFQDVLPTIHQCPILNRRLINDHMSRGNNFPCDLEYVNRNNLGRYAGQRTEELGLRLPQTVSTSRIAQSWVRPAVPKYGLINKTNICDTQSQLNMQRMQTTTVPLTIPHPSVDSTLDTLIDQQTSQHFYPKCYSKDMKPRVQPYPSTRRPQTGCVPQKMQPGIFSIADRFMREKLTSRHRYPTRSDNVNADPRQPHSSTFLPWTDSVPWQPSQVLIPDHASPVPPRYALCGQQSNLSWNHLQTTSVLHRANPNVNSVTDQQLIEGIYPRGLANINVSNGYDSQPQYSTRQLQGTPVLQIVHKQMHPVLNSVLPALSTRKDVHVREYDPQNLLNTCDPQSHSSEQPLRHSAVPKNPPSNTHSVSNGSSLRVFPDNFSSNGSLGSPCPPPLYFQDSAQAECDEVDNVPQVDPLEIELPSELGSCQFRMKPIPRMIIFKSNLDNSGIFPDRLLPISAQPVSIKVELGDFSDKLLGEVGPLSCPQHLTPSVASDYEQDSNSHENENCTSNLQSGFSIMEGVQVSKAKQNEALHLPNDIAKCQSQSLNQMETSKLLSIAQVSCGVANTKKTEDKTLESLNTSKQTVHIVSNQNKETESPVVQKDINEEHPLQNEIVIREGLCAGLPPQPCKQVEHSEECSNSKEGVLGMTNINKNRLTESIFPCKQPIVVQKTQNQSRQSTCGNDSNECFDAEVSVGKERSCVNLEDDSPLTVGMGNVNCKVNEKSDRDSRKEEPSILLETGESNMSVNCEHKPGTSAVTANESTNTLSLGLSIVVGSNTVSNSMPKEIMHEKDGVPTSPPPPTSVFCFDACNDVTTQTSQSSNEKGAQNAGSVRKLKKKHCTTGRCSIKILKEKCADCSNANYVTQVSKSGMKHGNNAIQDSEMKKENHNSIYGHAIQISNHAGNGIQSSINEKNQNIDIIQVSGSKQEEQRVTGNADHSSERREQESSSTLVSDLIQTCTEMNTEAVSLPAVGSDASLGGNIKEPTIVKARQILPSNRKHSGDTIATRAKKRDSQADSFVTMDTGKRIDANHTEAAVKTYEQINLDIGVVPIVTQITSATCKGNGADLISESEKHKRDSSQQQQGIDIIQVRRKKLRDALSLAAMDSATSVDGMSSKPGISKITQILGCNILDSKKHLKYSAQTCRKKLDSKTVSTITVHSDIITDNCEGNKLVSSKTIPGSNILDNQRNSTYTAQTCGKTLSSEAVPPATMHSVVNADTCGKTLSSEAVPPATMHSAVSADDKAQKPVIKTYGRKKKNSIEKDPHGAVDSSSNVNTCHNKTNSKDIPKAEIICTSNQSKPASMADVSDNELSSSRPKRALDSSRSTKISMERDNLNSSSHVAAKRRLEYMFECIWNGSYGKVLARKWNHTNKTVIHQCQHCSEKFSTKLALKRHLSDHDIGIVRKRPCHFCDFMCESTRLMELHVSSEHEDALLLGCGICNMFHKTANNLICHMKDVHDMVDTYNKVEDSDAEVSKHSSSQYRLTFKSVKKDLDSTILKVKNPIFRCNICKEMFLTPRELDLHLAALTKRKHHNVSHFKCVEMNKRCKLRHICSFCNNIFDSSSSLSQHVWSNHLAPYVCTFCTEHCKSMNSLEYHLLISHNNETLKCKICERVFLTFEKYYKHVDRHKDEEKRYVTCAVCSKPSANKSRLIQHMRTHTGETPYKCSYCPREFSLEWNLIQHERLHTGEKRYVCEVCGKAFTHNVSRKTHMKYHNGETFKQRAVVGTRSRKWKNTSKSKESSTDKNTKGSEERKGRRRQTRKKYMFF